jgi:hypothetical protein
MAEGGAGFDGDARPELTRQVVREGIGIAEIASAMAIFLYEKYCSTDSIADINVAVDSARFSAQIASEQPSLAGLLKTLGMMLGVRFRGIGDIRDLEEAIRVTQ